MYTENVISKVELVEARELTDQKITELQLKQGQLNELLNECEMKITLFILAKN